MTKLNASRKQADKTTSGHKLKPTSDRTQQEQAGVKINASEFGQELDSSDKPQSGSTPAHQKQKAPHSALQAIPDSEAGKPAQERVKPEGMTRSQWKKLKRIHRIQATWPDLFNLDNPKPLKVGVFDDMLRDIAGRSLAIGAGVLKSAIRSYTRRIRYKKAIAAGGPRYDLNGQPCGEITPEQQQEALHDINKAKGDPDNGR